MAEEAKKVVGSMAEILSSEDVEFREIEGFKENEVFRIGSLTAGDLIEWSEANEGPAKREAGLRLICKSLVNSEGVRFATGDKETVKKNLVILRSKSHKVCERIVKEILQMNGLEVGEADEPKKG